MGFAAVSRDGFNECKEDHSRPVPALASEEEPVLAPSFVGRVASSTVGSSKFRVILTDKSTLDSS